MYHRRAEIFHRRRQELLAFLILMNLLGQLLNLITPQTIVTGRQDASNLPHGFVSPLPERKHIIPQVLAAQTHRPTPTTPPAPTPPPDQGAVPYYHLINDSAKKYDVPQNILYNLLARESMHFNPSVISGDLNSPVGAQGIAQFMPSTAQGIGVDPLNPDEAIPAAANYLAQKYLQHGRDWRMALAAYNAGSGNVNKYGGVPPFKETQDYVKAILGE